MYQNIISKPHTFSYGINSFVKASKYQSGNLFYENKTSDEIRSILIPPKNSRFKDALYLMFYLV